MHCLFFQEEQIPFQDTFFGRGSISITPIWEYTHYIHIFYSPLSVPPIPFTTFLTSFFFNLQQKVPPCEPTVVCWESSSGFIQSAYFDNFDCNRNWLNWWTGLQPPSPGTRTKTGPRRSWGRLRASCGTERPVVGLFVGLKTTDELQTCPLVCFSSHTNKEKERRLRLTFLATQPMVMAVLVLHFFLFSGKKASLPFHHI